MFSTLPKTNFDYFSATFILSSANAFNLDQSINLSFGKELGPHFTQNDKAKLAITMLDLSCSHLQTLTVKKAKYGKFEREDIFFSSHSVFEGPLSQFNA